MQLYVNETLCFLSPRGRVTISNILTKNQVPARFMLGKICKLASGSEVAAYKRDLQTLGL